jgi:hypothetical protein
MSNASKKFTSEVGTYISEQEAQKLRDAFFKREKEKHNHEEFTRAYFFGKDKLQELLNYHSDIVGLRIYYGVDLDGDGIDDKKMVLYPVDKHGKDVIMHHKGDDGAALTRSAAVNADGSPIQTTGGGTALDGGLPCPVDCP